MLSARGTRATPPPKTAWGRRAPPAIEPAIEPCDGAASV